MDLSETNVGARIRLYRKSKNLSLAQLSKITRIAASNLSSIELNKTSPTLNTLAKIADAFGVRIGEFLDGILYKKVIISECNDKSPARNYETNVTEHILTRDAILNKLEAKIMIMAPNSGPVQVSPDNCDRFAFILKGRLSLTTEDEHFDLIEGQGFYLAPDSVASMENVETGIAKVLMTHTVK